MPLQINFLVDSLEEKDSLSPLAWILLWCNNVDHKDNCGDNKNIMNAIYGCNWMHSNTTCGGLNKFIIFLVTYIFKIHRIQK